MAKTFSSLESLVSYIKNTCHPDALKQMGDDSVETMKEVTDKQVEGQTGDIINCIGITSIDNDSVEIKWQDNGDWFSLVKDTYGDHMYAPWSNEHGKVWGKGHTWGNPIYKPATTLVETSKELIEKDAPDTYRRVMKSKGFKVK